MTFELVKTICAASFCLFLALLLIGCTLKRAHAVVFNCAVCLGMLIGVTAASCAQAV